MGFNIKPRDAVTVTPKSRRGPGLRLGTRPKCSVTSPPRGRKLIDKVCQVTQVVSAACRGTPLGTVPRYDSLVPACRRPFFGCDPSSKTTDVRNPPPGYGGFSGRGAVHSFLPSFCCRGRLRACFRLCRFDHLFDLCLSLDDDLLSPGFICSLGAGDLAAGCLPFTD